MGILSEITSESIWFTFTRSGGPGGQHVNKAETAVILHFNPELSGLPQRVIENILRQQEGRISGEGILLLRSENHRSRHRNLEDAKARLHEMIERAKKRPKKRRPTRPTKASRERRLKIKREHSQKKNLRKKPDF